MFIFGRVCRVLECLKRVGVFLFGIWGDKIFGIHHGLPFGVELASVDEIAQVDSKDLDDDKLDKLFPSEHDGVVGHKSYQHIPESYSNSDNITIKLLFVVDNHIPDISAQNNKNGNKQGGL